LGQVKSCKLKYFGHTTRHEGLEKDIMLGIKRRQGGQKKNSGSMISFNEAKKSGRNGKTDGEQKRLPVHCLVHEAAYARTSGTAS